MKYVMSEERFKTDNYAFAMGIDQTLELGKSTKKGILSSVLEILKNDYNVDIQTLQGEINSKRLELLEYKKNHFLPELIDFGDVIDRQIIGQIDFAGFQSDRTLRRFRDDLHNQVFRSGLTGVIVIKCLECDMIALFPFDKAIRTGANGVQNEGVLICFNNSFGNDRRKGNCKVAEGR